MKHNVFLSLGSNMGNRERYLKEAIREISHLDNVKVDKASNIYETEPVGYTDQECFLNMAVSIYTELNAETLLGQLQRIENFLDRKRIVKWGPRTIDIDILLFDLVRLNLEHLKIPHPLMFERAFVLIPLREIYHGNEVFGIDIEKVINNCDDKEGIKYYKKFEFLG
ncbi:2-amino-4-hydroxy-6-hydroxymethyldihydropteridine diphosphokinase [Herbivorax sp. ANBcel31]|uniref:2-amino-4-hydroxy-6- hydroxymethyldihydropteridine diphosphokinase n=1 Tax=Herbivorax sp. ANBcel31 TaxID=3069754 RepID=UPI0027B3F589|nr:2-amino-4-hydroxy-6-hydroxymethyldihydropteridine diphosphokinase [Herbivorax sp. ANBcel31]MDQ2086379.1 2-amino-4-hydroxy-6-hydroxymethyldihydropteridine diphosphokinase [Herbivorax sp. ANBcel31]